MEKSVTKGRPTIVFFPSEAEMFKFYNSQKEKLEYFGLYLQILDR